MASVDVLAAMGFEAAQSSEVLEQAGGDLDRALIKLLGAAEGSNSFPTVTSSDQHCSSGDLSPQNMLVEMGFGVSEVEAALQQANGDIQVASEMLLQVVNSETAFGQPTETARGYHCNTETCSPRSMLVEMGFDIAEVDTALEQENGDAQLAFERLVLLAPIESESAIGHRTEMVRACESNSQTSSPRSMVVDIGSGMTDAEAAALHSNGEIQRAAERSMANGHVGAATTCIYADSGQQFPAKPAFGDELGAIEVSTLSGQCFSIPVRGGQCMNDVKDAVVMQRPAPRGMIVQMIHDAGAVQGQEAASEFIGVPLTLLFTRLPLTENARALLRRCTCRCPEDGDIRLLEPPHLAVCEIPDLVQLVATIHPKRLILNYALSTSEHRFELAKEVKDDLKGLEVLEISCSDRQDVEHVRSILRYLPVLQRCSLTGGRLEAADVRTLRMENPNVSITIPR